VTPIAVIEVFAYTDPLGPWAWAAEPALRRMQARYDVRVRWVLVGFAREIDATRARGLAATALDVAAESGQPVDARLWLRDPPASSHPACIAVRAVAEQGDPGRYLRRVREAVFAEGRRMDRADALLDAAREVGGIDLDRLRIAFGSHGVLEAFGADVERSKAVPEAYFEPGTGRVAVPSIAVGDAWAVDVWRWEDWEAALSAAGGAPVRDAPGIEAALHSFGSMTAAEVAVVCDLPGPRAHAELWRLAVEWRVQARRVGGGELWSLSGA